VNPTFADALRESRADRLCRDALGNGLWPILMLLDFGLLVLELMLDHGITVAGWFLHERTTRSVIANTVRNPAGRELANNL